MSKRHKSHEKNTNSWKHSGGASKGHKHKKESVYIKIARMNFYVNGFSYVSCIAFSTVFSFDLRTIHFFEQISIHNFNIMEEPTNQLLVNAPNSGEPNELSPSTAEGSTASSANPSTVSTVHISSSTRRRIIISFKHK